MAANRFSFDRFTDAVTARLRGEQNRLIRELEESARDTIDDVVLRGMREGLNPDDIVDEIRNVIGLTDNQAQAVGNYHRLLSELSPDALVRQLRDPSYDVIVQDAIDSGIDLSVDVIDGLTEAYAENYVKHRARTIAQTESVRAANIGLHDAYLQAVARGVIPMEAVKREWQVALDERTCPICLSIPENHPDGVGLDEQFISIEGPQDNPPIHPNCRCSVEYVTDIMQIPEDELEAA